METKRKRLSTPDDFNVFIIGNKEKCKPCRLAHEKVKEFVSKYPEVTFGEWTCDMTREIANSHAQYWLESARERCPRLASHKTIPMVWINGKFVGGRGELFEILAGAVASVTR